MPVESFNHVLFFCSASQVDVPTRSTGLIGSFIGIITLFYQKVSASVGLFTAENNIDRAIAATIEKL
ncbi:hypothetical protein GZ77_01700 [Endozoicomonas montiporae]|uniref:Uncharacterized protein n=1 Tax=Endozoicomonas montiporae TaxID=1027273 RepID=A0A081NAB5_9GAMM|nr:hypothetical protein GZ77_01700 [Endozoicomonas montiporae]